MRKKHKNIDSIDLTKFILSLWVVAIHTSLFNNYIYPFVRLAVPVFFIFSGYFSFTKLNTAQNDFLKKEKLIYIIKRYLKLYFFWFVLLLPHTLYIRKYFRDGFFHGFLALIKGLFFGSTFVASWYIMATILGLIIIFYLSRRVSNYSLLLITIPIYLFSTAFAEFSGEIQSVPVLASISNIYEKFLGVPYFSFMIALLYIVLGKILADNVTASYKKKRNIILFLFCLIGLVIEYCLRLKSNSFIYSCDCLVMLAPAAYFFAAIILNLDIKIKYSKELSKLSTIIYCSHIPTLNVVSKCLQLCHINDPMNILKYVITVLLVICGGCLLLKLEKNHLFNFLKYSH